jgi:hypothetical protein
MLAWPAGRRTQYSNGFELGIDPDLWIGGHDLPRLAWAPTCCPA